ncbi:sigmaY antisigma factor component [Paenibacillus gansuensis]|uniref:SigmaY antisigma factor component n=1 Tax=Paenibacillus gansuensis TaxID=306542 RepID=A0ABW5PLI9_9BACL
MNRVDGSILPWYGWVLLALLLMLQSTWLFVDARRRGKLPWFWGLWGLIQFPMPILFYLIFVWRKARKQA